MQRDNLFIKFVLPQTAWYQPLVPFVKNEPLIATDGITASFFKSTVYVYQVGK